MLSRSIFVLFLILAFICPNAYAQGGPVQGGNIQGDCAASDCGGVDVKIDPSLLDETLPPSILNQMIGGGIPYTPKDNPINNNKTVIPAPVSEGDQQHPPPPISTANPTPNIVPTKEIKSEPAVPLSSLGGKGNIPELGPVQYSIDFSIGGTSLTPEEQEKLQKYLKQIQITGIDKIVIRSLVSPQSDQPENETRRLSLTRARAIKKILVDHGFSEAAIDLLAQGSKDQNPTNPVTDRVELYFLSRQAF